MALTAVIDLTVKKPDFKTMKSEIKELTVAAQQAVIAFGEFSPEAAAAERKLAAAKDQMQDFNDRVNAINPDKFARVNTVVQGVASGFAAAQGAMALFGADSENLQKTMVKLQGAMALSQGLEGLGKIQQQFGAIFTDVVSGAKKAFAAIKAGIGSTGIGLLVIALGSIVAYWDDIKEAVSGVSDEQKDLLKTTQKTAEANEKNLDNISKTENILKAQGKTEEEILNIKINAAKVSIKGLRAQLTTQENIRQSQIDASTRNRDILQGMIRFVSSPLALLLQSIDSTGKVFGKNFGLEEGFSKGIANMVFDPIEVEKEADLAIQKSKDGLLKLENDIAGHEIAIKNMHTKAVEDSKKSEQDKVNAKTSAAEQILTIEQENELASTTKEEEREIKRAVFFLENAQRDVANSKFTIQEKQKMAELLMAAHELKLSEIDKTFRDKEIESAKKTAEELKQFMIKSAAEEEKFIEEEYNKQKLLAEKEITDAQALADKLNEIEIARLNNLIQAKKDAGLSTTELELQLADKTKEISQKSADDQIKSDNAVREAKESLYKGSIDLANSIISLAGEQSKTGKALALGVIAADTAMAITGALNVTQKPSPDNVATGGIAGAAKYIALAAMILTNAKRARDILKGGQPSAPQGVQISGGGMPQMAAPQVSSILPEVKGFDQRVFVTEGDITRTQNRVQNIKKVSVVK